MKIICKSAFSFAFCLLVFIYLDSKLKTKRGNKEKALFHSGEKIVNLENRDKATIGKPVYLILEYTKVFGTSKYCNQRIDEIPKFNKNNKRYNLLEKCAFKNCFFTCEKSFRNEADALLFHSSDLTNEIQKNKKDFDNLIKNRTKHQVWILWQDKPFNNNSNFDYFKFNWTISFNRNSEAFKFAFGGTANYMIEKPYEQFIQKMMKNFEDRKSSAVWFVSNCNNKYRLDFANKLGARFSLKVGGLCSKSLSSVKKRINCPKNSACEASQLAYNKFYLAFESTNCTDYITDKFWRSLSLGLIPVVIQPSRESYERVAPPDSFIHAQDFNFDAKLLAQYLLKVSTNFHFYLKHLKWSYSSKSYYKSENLEPKRFCQLCERLNRENSSIYYDSVSNWFKNQCLSD